MEVHVQEIASKSLSEGTIPSEFVRTENEQPGITTFHGPITSPPIIDLSEKDEKRVGEKMAKAASEWGLFQIVRHDIPDIIIHKLQQVGREFFELSQEEKEKYAKPPEAKSIEGYGTKLQKEVDGKKGWVDHLFHKIWPPNAINHQFWPQHSPQYREANEKYAECLHGVVNKLFRLLGEGLGMEGRELQEAVGGENLVYLLKINYYPPCPRPDVALGVPPHTDMSSLTILVPNDVKGLQVFRDDHWFDVQYIPNALIIHIGDQLEIVSNGKYKAVFHRTTVDKDKTRMSWPVFLEPPPEMEVGPHPKAMDDNKPAKYKKKKYADYCYCKLNKIPQ
uniref:Fe2OG dioxygenase domain-containing protein n=1 Tax=Kalanchoe fedtschenkoi TaxID=63787 RepID=A0A7N0TQZ6_KALFE